MIWIRLEYWITTLIFSHLGPRTSELLDTLNALDQDEKDVLIKEAQEILNCNNPNGITGSVIPWQSAMFKMEKRCHSPY